MQKNWSPKKFFLVEHGFEPWPLKWMLTICCHLVICFANFWNEREADNAPERRDFEDDEVKSHIL